MDRLDGRGQRSGRVRRRNFPQAAEILDFQHGAAHLAAFAKKFRRDTSDRLLAAWCHTLKHAGGAMMIRVIERLDRKKMAADVREGHADLLGYLQKNVGRMDYPHYLGQGWNRERGGGVGMQDGGESAAVSRRDAWGEEGSDAVAHLRALYRSDPDQWEAFWGYAMAASTETPPTNVTPTLRPRVPSGRCRCRAPTLREPGIMPAIGGLDGDCRYGEIKGKLWGSTRWAKSSPPSRSRTWPTSSRRGTGYWPPNRCAT